MYFELAEFHDRFRRVKDSMFRKTIEVLVVSDPSNMNYLTGYDGWSFYVHQGLIISLDHDQPIWWGRGMDGNGAKITTWLSSDNIRPYEDNYVQNPLKHPMSFVADIIKEHGWSHKRVGAEKDNYWFTGRSLEVLGEALGKGGDILDGTGLVNWERVIKSPQEIEYMRKASKVTEKVMNSAVASIRAGKPERTAAANVYHACINGTDDTPGDHPAFLPIMPTNERTTCAHLGWDPDRVYADGDLVLLELCGVHRRYHCPLSRTVFLGTPPAKLRNIADAVLAGTERVLGFIKPGVTAEEVEAQWRDVIASYGVVKPSRLGYSIGASYVPDWGERTISLRPGDKTVLKAGMTMHLMPGIWEDDMGFESSEPYLITENGCETFMSYPRGILIP
jgi:Xaa-Pro dipeptidase